MEALYAKLYDKYQKLKKKKLSEMDDINGDQEKKFLNYVSAAEELIQHLKTENEKLQSEVYDLKSEVASVRSSNDEECVKLQMLLMEESKKNKLLSEEVGRLQKLQIEEHRKGGKNDNIHVSSPGCFQVAVEDVSGNSSRRMTRKRGRNSRVQIEATGTPDFSNQDNSMVRESAKDLSNGTLSQEVPAFDQQPECCIAGAVANGSVLATCPFRTLIECLVGMEVSTVNQAEGPCISALHQSSGYSFNLTWVAKADGGETEFLYRVSSLGTFERIAPEWMREVIIFSTRMCPIFFERISRLIKSHC
ncbi:hypothetical protein SLA2020_107960 [Shorea laevis]